MRTFTHRWSGTRTRDRGMARSGGRRRSWGPAWRYAGDIAPPVVLFAATLLQPLVIHEETYGELSAGGAAIGALTCLPLLARRRWPLPVLAATVTGALSYVAVTGLLSPSWLAVPIAVYTVAAQAARSLRLIADAAAVLLAVFALTAGVALLSAGELPGPHYTSLVAWTGVAGIVGYAVRSWREYVRAVRDRVLRAEQGREQEARRRVAEERLRVARDLHDVVAHHIAVINVQAGVAAHLLREQPEAAQQALAHIRQASRTVLDELGNLLGMLRQQGDPRPTDPAPSLARLDGLVESFTATGLAVERSLSGRPRPLPAPIDQAAYRVVQESLTNVHRHGKGMGARVRITYNPTELRIEVQNVRNGASAHLPPTGNQPGPSTAGENRTGLGILGMRERVATVGGRLDAGPEPDGGFLVQATMPLPGPTPAPPATEPARR